MKRDKLDFTVYTLLRGILLFVPAFILLPSLVGDVGLWLAIPTAEFLTCIIIVSLFLLQQKR